MIVKDNLTKLFLLVLFFFTSLSQTFGQAELETNRNAIHLIPGTGIFWYTVTLSYERKIKERSFIRAGAGLLRGHDEDSGEYLFAQYGYILGKNNHHFEISAGPAFIRTTWNDIPFSASGGYRFQKPNGWFIFRAGAAYPELYFLSAGVAF